MEHRLVGSAFVIPLWMRVSGIIRPLRGEEDVVIRKRFSMEQIVAVLKQAEMGAPVAELFSHLGVAE